MNFMIIKIEQYIRPTDIYCIGSNTVVKLVDGHACMQADNYRKPLIIIHHAVKEYS